MLHVDPCCAAQTAKCNVDCIYVFIVFMSKINDDDDDDA